MNAEKAPAERDRAMDDVADREEVIAILVERDRHYAVSREEGLLDAITVMDVNVKVEHTRVMTVE